MISLKSMFIVLSIFGILGVFAVVRQCHAQPQAPKAVAVIKATTANSEVSGVVSLEETDKGLKIEAVLENVPGPGKHGFHIHEFGSCEDEGKAAGGHYNPEAVQHGLLEKDGHQMAHAGDMGNVVVDEAGYVQYSGLLPGVSLTSGSHNVAGRAIILHEKEDDFGQPTGNAGGRIGCGAIILVP